MIGNHVNGYDLFQGFESLALRWIVEWPVGQVVKTPPFHGGNMGSNPVRVILICYFNIAGWSSLVARRAHNPKVVGSNPSPATKWSRSSVGRAKDWKSLCRWFDSDRDHHFVDEWVWQWNVKLIFRFYENCLLGSVIKHGLFPECFRGCSVFLLVISHLLCVMLLSECADGYLLLQGRYSFSACAFFALETQMVSFVLLHRSQW